MQSSNIDVVANLRQLKAANPDAPAILPTELASAFGWDGATVRPRTISFDGTRIEVGRGYLGVQPAALFAVPEGHGAGDPVGGAALYGYHTSIRWGVLTDERGVTAFNSHWLLGDRWFTLPMVPWETLSSGRQLLESFRPEDLADGAPDRYALERYSSPRLLQPVDDELVERLDAWRDQALKSSKFHTGVDERLQTLFAKLFVLRTIEDRALAPEVPPLSAAVTPPQTLNISNLINTFEKAREYIGSELFSNVSMDEIPEHVIAGIITDLYVPRKLPFGDHRYNFSWIDSDILGLAYEKYLSSVLQPIPPNPQMDLFENVYRGIERISVRRAGGVYYTPPFLTKYLAKKSIDEFYTCHDSSDIPRIIDFACGSGSFLVAAMDVLLARLKRLDSVRNWAKHLIETGMVNGIDVDEKAVTVARLNLWNRLTEEPNPLPLPDLSKVVVQGSGLDISSWAPLPLSYDIVLGNPPFLATAHVSNRETLSAIFETAKGRFDFSYLFVEQAMRVTAPQGIIGLVVPNRLFRNRNADTIRRLITTSMNVLTIVDFGSTEVFQGTSAYIGCVIAMHQPILSEPSTRLKVIDVRALPQHFVTALLIDAEAGLIQGDPEIRVYEAQHPRGPGPWILLSATEKRAQINLANASVSLTTIAGIFQGIRTGANDVFILKVEAEDEQYGVQITNGLGDSAVLERGLLRPVVFGSEVRKYEAVRPEKYLLYPYINKMGNPPALPG